MWRPYVGLSPESLSVVMQRVNTLELLLDKNDVELRVMLNHNVNIREEEVRRLLRAMFNLKRCREAITGGSTEPNELFWDSWDRHHHTAGASPRAHRSTTRFQQQQQQQNRAVKMIELVNDLVNELENDLVNEPADSTDFSASRRKNSVSHVSGENPSEKSSNTMTWRNAENRSERHGNGSEQWPSQQRSKSPLLSTVAGGTGGGGHSHNMHSDEQQQLSPPISTATTTHFNSITTANDSAWPSNNSTQNRQNCCGSVWANPPPVSIEHNPIVKCKSNDATFNAAGETVMSTSMTTTPVSSSSSSSSATANHVNGNANITGSISNMSNMPTPRSRLHTEPSPDNYNDIAENPSNLTVPRSPCTPIVTRGMGHMIAHRFTKKFKVMSTCDLCNKQMFFGLKCKECKYRCHKDCESNVPPSCGLPPEFIDEFKRSLPSDVFMSNTIVPSTPPPPPLHAPTSRLAPSPNMGNAGKTFLSSGRRDRHRSQAYTTQYTTGPDSSSAGSSCNSSSPSSPALLTVPPQTPAASKHTQFHFPEIPVASDAVLATSRKQQQQPAIITGTKTGRKTDEDWTKPMSDESTTPAVTKPTGADKSNATRSTASVRTPVIELADTSRSNESGSISASTDSVRSDSTEERESTNWPRQNSLSLKEWDIPFGDLNLLEKIGRGRFGTVHRGLWHGDVAVKLLNEDYLDDDRTLEAFKLEVATFKKTRHENLVLFMGFCMKPQAIVTSLCKGNTLYTHIHLRKDKFNLYRATLVAQQISQGMGYLHAKDIVHKDLKTKNIFLENGKVIITDFGVFSAIKLQYSKEGLCISNNWLCYLAPELIRGLRPIPPAHDELQFSKASDVYAFGTVWYELLCGEFPFKRQPPEAIIFQIGRGMKQTLANIQASRDVKDILMLCWAFQPDDRPDFPKLLTLLERLPKKRLARSPSHPVQLSRSAESVF